MNNYKEINVNDINLANKPFSFSFPELDAKLIDSISNNGLINPPLLLLDKKNSKFLIVSGLKRIKACKSIGLKFIPSFIINEKIEEPAKFILLNLKANLSHRELNNIEKANLFKLLKVSGISREQMITRYMPMLKLEKSRKVYEDIFILNSLDIKSKNKIIEWELPLKTSTALAKYSKPDMDAAIKMLEILNPGINRLKEIMMLLEETALLKRCSIKNIIARYLAKTIGNHKTGRKEKTEEIRMILRGLRYPQSTRMEKQWDEYVGKLRLPPEIKILRPQSFEGKKIKMEITFSAKENLKRSILQINKTLETDSIEKLIGLIEKELS